MLTQSLREMKTELSKAKGLADEVARTAEELDEEMPPASRLQQAFLPRQLPKVGSVRFSVQDVFLRERAAHSISAAPRQ